MKIRVGVGALLASLALWPAVASAQSLTDTVEAIQHARVSTRILFITAHPDDESPSLITYLARGRGANVALLTITRGQGGQNAIGPEQGDRMGMVRTAELQSADELYGVQQFFTGAPDFGYSKSAEETLEKWDNIALEDMVRVIRTFRPNIVINGWGGVHSGHGQHQASGILTPRAVAAAADPKQFPEQLTELLAPWKTEYVLDIARGDAAGALRIPSDEISPLLGKSYAEIGSEGRALHRSQGDSAFYDAPFFRRPVFLKVEDGGELKPDSLWQPLSAIADRFPDMASELRPTLLRAEDALGSAERSALSLAWPDAGKELAQAGIEIADLEAKIEQKKSADASEISWELQEIRARINNSLVLATALRHEARADRWELVAGENFSVRVSEGFRKETGLEIESADLKVPAGWGVTSEKDDSGGAALFKVAIPADAKPNSPPAEAVLPWPLPLAESVLKAKLGSYEFSTRVPVVMLRASPASVDTFQLTLVPAVSLTVEPQQWMLPEKNIPQHIELLARVNYHGTQAARVEFGMDAPPGWKVDPVEPMQFSGAAERLVRFRVAPPRNPAAGAIALQPFVRLGGETFRTSVEPLVTLPTRIYTQPATATVHVLDLTVPENLRVGYVAAENDPIPEELRQIGIHVDLLDQISLAFGDLRQYDAIAIGIRAYELRHDLAEENPRLLDYVAAGGTLLVQYEKGGVWNSLKPAPYPASQPQQTLRTTDENSPVRFLAPDSRLLQFPNRISLADFQGWAQERGLYYWGTFDAKYQAVLALRDPGEAEDSGALVWAGYGKGVYIYTGLSFFRQLPAGVPGAYRLFVNLLSQSRSEQADAHSAQ